MFALLFAFVSGSLIGSSALAQTPAQVCVQTCQAYSTPGYELRSCVARCADKAKASLPAAMTSKQKEAYALRCQLEPSLCQ